MSVTAHDRRSRLTLVGPLTALLLGALGPRTQPAPAAAPAIASPA